MVELAAGARLLRSERSPFATPRVFYGAANELADRRFWLALSGHASCGRRSNLCSLQRLRLAPEPQILNLSMFSQFQRILDVYTKISDRTDLGVAQQNLDRTEVSGCLVDDCCFGTPKRMRAIVFTSLNQF